jgi:pimeloyl-ACP methyl ester carboxylesterase
MTDTSLMTIPHFVRELDSLRAALGYDRIHLLGHSWGTILAFEYYRAHPEHVVSLTLGSAALDIPTWERNARRLVGTLSDSAQSAIRVRAAEQKFDAPDHQRAGAGGVPTIRRFASLTPGATAEVIPGAAHVTTWDNPEVMVRVVRRFLRKVDAGGGRASN